MILVNMLILGINKVLGDNNTSLCRIEDVVTVYHNNNKGC